LGEAYVALTIIGWDRVSLFDEEDVVAFDQALIAAGEKYVLEEKDTVWLAFGTIDRLADRRDLKHLRVIKEFLRLRTSQGQCGLYGPVTT
jgi:hypothetical protein